MSPNPLQNYPLMQNPALDGMVPADQPLQPIQAASAQQDQLGPIGGGAPDLSAFKAAEPNVKLQGFQPNPLRQQREQGLMEGINKFEHPASPQGFWGKTGHVLSTIGNIAGDIFAPSRMALIPGTQLHGEAQQGQRIRDLQELEGEDRQDQQQFDKEQQEQLKQPLQEAQTRVANAQADKLENPPDTPDKFTFQQTDHGLMRIDNTTGEATPVTFQGQVLQPKPAEPKEISAENDIKNQIAQASEAGDQAKVKMLQDRLKALNPMGQERINLTVRGQDLAGDRAAGNVSRQDVRAHDKAYVQPAEGVEKSYQMMDHAYQEFENARKQGKTLPTGAQSMLALSTHLSTTFGNVKGARVTKDMIEHHLGARSISDSALVAVQKLTNGDALSPEQWDAFHDLIKQSRNLSWSTAVKEAARKHIPIDFLPQDLQTINRNGVTYAMGQDGQYHKGGANAAE